MASIRKTFRNFKRGYFAFSQRLRNYPRESEIFLKIHGYPLNLKDPRSFTEKIIWRKIYDRNPLFPVITDKLRVRDYLRQKLGAEAAEEILIPLYYHSADPAALPFDDLPVPFVIKPNHSNAKVIFVKDINGINREEVIAKCRQWLSKTHGFYRFEWAYQKIKPEILVEKMLLDDDVKIPNDYKFHVFQGKCKRIAVCSDRFSGGRRVTGYDVNWNYSDVVTNDPDGQDIPKPENFSKMLALVEKLGEDLDYVRVDLYNIQGRIYFGELTIYPLSGDGTYSPKEFDLEMGSYWKLPGSTRRLG